MIQKTVLTFDTSCTTREEIRQISQMSLFSLSCFSLVVSLQIQTSDRQRLSMFWSPEWIFPAHPSVRVFFWGPRRGTGACLCLGPVGWMGGGRRSDAAHITSQAKYPNSLMYHLIWSLSYPYPGLTQALPSPDSPIVRFERPFFSLPMQPSMPISCFLSLYFRLNQCNCFDL